MIRRALALVALLTLAACTSRPPRPVEPIEPPKQAGAVVVHDFMSPHVMVEGARVVCSGTERGLTNADGYLAFEVVSNAVLDCEFTKDQYETQTASHYFTPEHTTLSTWMKAEPTPTPEPGEHPNPLVGRLRLADGCFRDDTGCVNPIYAHAGDLFSLFIRDEARALKELDDTAAAGYHGIRVWTALGCHPTDLCRPGDYWHNREVGPQLTADYYAKLRAFFEATRARKLRLVLSQGDIKVIADRRQFMETVAALDGELGVVDFLDCGNEAWQTGESDPNALARCIGYYATAGGRALKSTTSADGDPTYQDIDKWAIPPSDVFDVHSGRNNHSWDKRRYAWSYTYCGEGCPRVRYGISSEPPGNGELVSVTSNKHELDDEAVALIAVGSLTGRQAHVWFSGEGVKINRGLHTEAGFASTPRAVALLPRDLMTYETSHHSGETWRNTRVLVAQGEVRVDGRTAADGRFTYVIDGPAGRYALRVQRSFEGQLCDPGTGTCQAVSADAGSTFAVEFRRGRLLIGRVR